MGNITEYVERLQELTKQNLDILRAINDSFFTKREHIHVTVGDAQYALPSFIALENKINALQENFSNLVYAPKTGEATFNMDGNSRTIELKGYTNTPNRLTIDAASIPGFSVEQNDIFKDFLTPNPYIRIDLQSLPNDITTVNVRKVALKSQELRDIAFNKLGGGGIVGMNWSDLYKILSIYKEDTDFVQYDTIRQLPVRQNIGSGTYTIKSIDNDEVDNVNYNEFITLTLHEDLKYILFDETIEKYFAIGDQLVTYDDSAKMEIVEVNHAARQIKVKVLNGDYLNLVADPDGDLANDMCKLKYFSAVDYDADKYINIPLEEDRFVAVFVAPLNSRMNVQGPWGGGILIDTDEIRWTADGMTRFRDYYETNVRNVGDILYEVSAAMTTSIMKYSEDDFNTFTGYIPTLDTTKLRVMQINTHLNNSSSVKTIRSLYSQKLNCNTELTEVQDKITDINKSISELAFDDTSGIRQTYEAQLSQYNKRRAELSTSMSKIINDINNEVNNSTVPLENAKYRIRGYYNWFVRDENIDPVLAKFWNHIHGIKVQYRYKNQNMETGTATSIDSNFIFSDWNEMPSMILTKTPSYRGGYSFAYPQYETSDGTTSHDTGNINEPSFNQIDIPISQGESVDIRLKIVWDFGYPFIETTSEWSEIINIPFPEEYVKDIKLMDIISQNNLDYEADVLKNVLEDNGTNGHISDKLIDQDVTYYHKPENIASGFYTEERRVIPLKDKLVQMNRDLTQLKDAVGGTDSTALSCVAIIEGIEYDIFPDKENVLTLPEYRSTEESTKEGASDRVHTEQFVLKLTNKSNHAAYLYSMFPAAGGVLLNNLKTSKYDLNDYCSIPSSSNSTFVGGVYLGYRAFKEVNGVTQNVTNFKLQTSNQWLTFRIKDIYTGADYYAKGIDDNGKASLVNNINLLTNPDVEDTGIASSFKSDWMTQLYNENRSGLIIYPYITNDGALKISGDNVYNKMTLNPGESVSVDIMAHYKFDVTDTANMQAQNVSSISKFLSFDIRTSLYSEPTNYIIKVTANDKDTIQDRVFRAGRTRYIGSDVLTSRDKLYKV